MQKGDSLYSIASKYNTTINEIKKLNSLTNNTLSIGDTLKIPSKNKTDIDVDTTAPSNTYVVQYGDTIQSIARDNNLDVDDLINLNNLADYELYVGQILKLPTYAGEDVVKEGEYVVKKGDSLYQIAIKNNTTIEELKKLDVGQILKLPTKETNEKVEIIPESNTYVVKRGDSLYSIALSNNTTVDELKRLNNLTSNLLSVGMVLKLPKTETEEIVYTVKRGDSLYSIAREYNTTVNEIKKLNNLTSNLLSIGQTIRIPL